MINLQFITDHINAIIDIVIKHLNNNIREWECSICYENNKDNLITSSICNHIFHKNCINEWLANNNTCPYCRKKFNIKPFDDVELDSYLDIYDASENFAFINIPKNYKL
jgi:hypothetical protein